MSHIIATRHGHLLEIGLDRPEAQNRFTQAMLGTIGRLLREADDDPEVRAILLTGKGDDFCLGGDIADILPAWKLGIDPIAPGDINPTGLSERKLTKPLVTIVHGGCRNGGLEFALAADICIAADNARFAFEEIRTATFPFAGGVFRFAGTAGRSNALRYILTGDAFDATEALRMNVVAEVKPLATVYEYGFALATRIANAAPLGVSATLTQMAIWSNAGDDAALKDAIATEVQLLNSRDCAEAMQAAAERRAPLFSGS
jgi:enoyl-CoA hydratase